MKIVETIVEKIVAKSSTVIADACQLCPCSIYKGADTIDVLLFFLLLVTARLRNVVD